MDQIKDVNSNYFGMIDQLVARLQEEASLGMIHTSDALQFSSHSLNHAPRCHDELRLLA